MSLTIKSTFLTLQEQIVITNKKLFTELLTDAASVQISRINEEFHRKTG